MTVDISSYVAQIANGSTNDAAPLDSALNALASAINTQNAAVTSLPGSPVDGQEVFYVADSANGIVWHLKYRAASASAYKWEFVGGSPLAATVDTEDSVTSATYAVLTNALTLTIPLAGDWNIDLSAHMRPSIDNNNVVKTGWWSYDVGATGAVDADAIHWRFALNNNGGITDFGANMHRRRRKNGLTASTVLTTKARASAASTFVGDRMIAATPIRVG